jgi:hypothetical protein
MTVHDATTLYRHNAVYHQHIRQYPRHDNGKPELRIDTHLCLAASGGAVRVLDATRHTHHAHLCTSTTNHHDDIPHRRSGTVAEASRGSGVGPWTSIS